MNTTGFAAEALLHLYLLTREEEYLDLSYLCLANVFDNLWLWNGDYGNAHGYETFFGMFPLPDAPYLAAYEELENAAKFREYLRLANDDVLPSVRLLLAEYCRFVLDRAWYYFPKHLPKTAVAEHVQNGRINRELAVPLEDLREGSEKSGQVGQEIYGSGIAPGLVVRHYHYIDSMACWLFCDYPAFGLRIIDEPGSATISFYVAGDERTACSVRIVPLDFGKAAPTCRAFVGRRHLAAVVTPEGSYRFAIPGNSTVRLRLVTPLKGS